MEQRVFGSARSELGILGPLSFIPRSDSTNFCQHIVIIFEVYLIITPRCYDIGDNRTIKDLVGPSQQSIIVWRLSNITFYSFFKAWLHLIIHKPRRCGRKEPKNFAMRRFMGYEEPASYSSGKKMTLCVGQWTSRYSSQALPEEACSRRLLRLYIKRSTDTQNQEKKHS